jgi:hypothetical protein
MDMQRNTHKPSGNPEPEREDLLSPDDVDYLPEPTQGESESSIGGTVDPRSSENRQKGLEQDRQLFQDQNGDDDEFDDDDEDDEFEDDFDEDEDEFEDEEEL